LGGTYQAKNTNTVLWAIDLLRGHGLHRHPRPHPHNPGPYPAAPFVVSEDNIHQAFAHITDTTGLCGRWQILRREPLVVCDTGHNVGGWQYLAPQIKAQPCHTCRMVFGMVDDKDIDTVMQLLPKDATYYWAQASSKRAIPSAVVAAKGAGHQLRGRNCGTVAEAYQAAMADARPMI
jgi:dihydrofolate synthase/folylpolyglutamate synthase